VLKDFEAGMDLNLHHDPYESFKIFQGRILAEYDRLAPLHRFQVLDAADGISDQQRRVRQQVETMLKKYKKKSRIA
jgi:dTMP kinase